MSSCVQLLEDMMIEQFRNSKGIIQTILVVLLLLYGIRY